MGEIKAVIFDIGGVLELPQEGKDGVGDAGGVYEYMAEQFGIGVDEWFDSIEVPYADSVVGKVSKEETLRKMADNLDTTPERLEELFLRAYREHFSTNGELYEIAFKLKEKGYKIAILSDQWQVSSEAFVREDEMKKFDVVVVSCDVGVRKPDPKIYKTVLERLGMDAGECVFIDNRDWNTEAGESLGLNCILFENNKQTLEELRNLGVRI